MLITSPAFVVEVRRWTLYVRIGRRDVYLALPSAAAPGEVTGWWTTRD